MNELARESSGRTSMLLSWSMARAMLTTLVSFTGVILKFIFMTALMVVGLVGSFYYLYFLVCTLDQSWMYGTSYQHVLFILGGITAMIVTLCRWSLPTVTEEINADQYRQASAACTRGSIERHLELKSGSRLVLGLLSIVCMPGLFFLLLIAVFFCMLPMSNLPGFSEFGLGFASILPVAASLAIYKSLRSRSFRIVIGSLGLMTVYGQDQHVGYIVWERIEQVRLERLDHVKEEHYHADDFDQQKLVFSGGEQEPVSINLQLLKHRQRRQLAEALRAKLPGQALTDSGLSFIDELCPRAVESVSEKRGDDELPQLPESFTDIWQKDMNRHIARTNYVPLDVDSQLQNGRLSVKAYLASGGFSTTYLAEMDGETVVIKESALPAGLPADQVERVSAMFAREARLLQRCDHDQIARVLDFFHADGREYLVLEYIEGERLSDLIGHKSGISERQCIRWAFELAGLLVYLHGLEPPIIHRDFTPDNLILDQSGRLNLIDFGAANEFLGGATGTLIGKQSYIAPEQFQGKATTQSDIYALGATMHFMLTGREPLPLSKSCPADSRDDISESLNDLVAACTALDTDGRITSAGQLLNRLEDLAEKTGSIVG